jgi:hypothetical protein
LTIVDTSPVALRDLADQLGISFGALHQQVKAQRVPAFTLSERRGAPLYVAAEIARQVREWHAANRFRPWPTFPLQEDAGER